MRRTRVIFEPQPENWLTAEKVARLCAAVNSRFNGPDDQEMRDAIVATIYRAQLMQAALLPKPEGHPTARTLRFAHLVIDLQARYRITHDEARKIVASVVPGVTVDSLESAQERVRKSGGVAGADLAANGGVHKQFRALVRNTADRLAREYFAHLVIDLQARYRVTHDEARKIVASVVPGVTVDSLESAQERVRKSGGVAGADLAANGGVHKQFRALVRNTADRLARELKLRPRADIATHKEARAQEIERMTELHATEMAQLDAEAPDLAKFVHEDSLTLKGAMIQLEARRKRTP